MVSNKPSVFISYAHKDGMEFTRRLAFALSMYMDVFWDRRLQAGEYPPQLFKEIEARDFILLVMSPYSLSSKWCLTECNHAVCHRKKVVLARIYDDCHSDLEKELTGKYTYGPFNEDFEAGFRRITQMILGQPYSSWETYIYADDKVILDGLSTGFIPGLIGKTIAEWGIAEKLWPILVARIEKHYSPNSHILWGEPRTPIGILRQCQSLEDQFNHDRNMAARDLVKDIREIVEPYIKQSVDLRDDNHKKWGRLTSKIISSTRLILEQEAVTFRNFGKLGSINNHFDFEVAEKIREYLNIFARRSRYLY